VYNSKNRGANEFLADAGAADLFQAFSDPSSDQAPIAALKASARRIFARLNDTSVLGVARSLFTQSNKSVVAVGVQARSDKHTVTRTTCLVPSVGAYFGKTAMDFAKSKIPTPSWARGASPAAAGFPPPRPFKTAYPYNVLGLPYCINGYMIRFPPPLEPTPEDGAIMDQDPVDGAFACFEQGGVNMEKIVTAQNYFQIARAHETGPNGSVLLNL
jgi:hypothetical protein